MPLGSPKPPVCTFCIGALTVGVAELPNSELEPEPKDNPAARALEDALRHLTDYAHLGEHPLAELAAVRNKLPPGRLTHLERGKALYRVLEEAIERLRPSSGRPGDPPARVNTFPSRVPIFSMDRIYARGLRCRSTSVPRGASWARMSDHLPLVAELELD